MPAWSIESPVTGMSTVRDGWRTSQASMLKSPPLSTATDRQPGRAPARRLAGGRRSARWASSGPCGCALQKAGLRATGPAPWPPPSARPAPTPLATARRPAAPASGRSSPGAGQVGGVIGVLGAWRTAKEYKCTPIDRTDRRRRQAGTAGQWAAGRAGRSWQPSMASMV